MDTYNQSLISSGVEVNIYDYIHQVNDMLYGMELGYMDELFELTKKEGQFVVHHDMLSKYDVVEHKDTSHVKRTLDRYKLVEGADYVVMTCRFPPSGGKSNEGAIAPSGANGGRIPNQYYYFCIHPKFN